jgi:AcrR family transcriptional regulator
MRTTSEKAQRAIAEAALITFGKRGYAPATLEEIGAQVDLTRGAVLHHFKSKGRLLAAVVDPYRQALAQLLITTPLNDPPTANQRRQLLTRFVDVFIAHRQTLGLLANDISARAQLGLEDQWFMPPVQLVSLLAGSKANDVDQVRVAAAIGAIIQPVTWAWVDVDSPDARAELIEAAVVILHGPRATASDSASRIGATSPKVAAASVMRVAAS